MWAITAGLLAENSENALAGTRVTYEGTTFQVVTKVDSNPLIYIRPSSAMQISYQMAKLCAQYITYIVWAYMMDTDNPDQYIKYLREIDEFLGLLHSHDDAPYVPSRPDPPPVVQRLTHTPDTEEYTLVKKTKTHEQAIALLTSIRTSIIRWWYLLYTWSRIVSPNLILKTNNNATIPVSKKTLTDELAKIADIHSLAKSIDTYLTDGGDIRKTTDIRVQTILDSIAFHEGLSLALASAENEGTLLADASPSLNLDIRIKLRLDRNAMPTNGAAIRTFNIVKTTNRAQHILMNESDTNSPSTKPTFLFGPFTKVYAQEKGGALAVAGELVEYITNKLPRNSVFVLMGYGASGAGKTSYLVGRRDGKGEYPGVLVHVCSLLKVPKSAITFSQWYLGKQELFDVGKIREYDTEPTNDTPNFSFFENVMMNPDRRITRPTINNPTSSRGHMIAHINLGDGKSIMFGDLAGFENEFACGTVDAPGLDAIHPTMKKLNAVYVQRAFGKTFALSQNDVGNLKDRIDSLLRANWLTDLRYTMMPAGWTGNVPMTRGELLRCVRAYSEKLKNAADALKTRNNIEPTIKEINVLKNQYPLTGKDSGKGYARRFIDNLQPPRTGDPEGQLRAQIASIATKLNVAHFNQDVLFPSEPQKPARDLNDSRIKFLGNTLPAAIAEFRAQTHAEFTDPFYMSVRSLQGYDLTPDGVERILEYYIIVVVECVALHFEQAELARQCITRNQEGTYIRSSLLALRTYMSHMTSKTPPSIPLDCMKHSMESLVETSENTEKPLPSFPFSIDQDISIDRICLFGVVDVNNVNKWKTAYYSTATVLAAMEKILNDYNICKPRTLDENSICDDTYATSLKAAIDIFRTSFSTEETLTHRVDAIWTNVGHQGLDIQEAARKTVDIIANHNEGTPVGVMEFLDKMAKFGRIDRACTIDQNRATALSASYYTTDALSNPAMRY